jgi:hypothetical protein
MDSTLSSSPSESRTKPTKQFICYMCDKTFDSVETLDSHKTLEHSELGQSKRPAGVG